MLNDEEKDIILTCAHRYGVTELYLFGSTLESDQYRDIDLAVTGIPPELFFKFYGELLRKLSKPVDIIDLTQESRLTEIIRQEGSKIYG